MRERIKPYMKFAPTVALMFGFVFDIFTLNRPDAAFENIVIVGYLLISATVIILLQNTSTEKRTLILMTILQFSFGNLASALMILYALSGTLAGSAIFVGILGGLFLGNELFKDRYARTTLQIAIWFFLILTYSTLIVPVIVGSLGIVIFGISVVMALFIVALLIQVLSLATRVPFVEHAKTLRVLLLSIAGIFSILYFLNFIPPVPLATKHMGIYHNITRLGESYVLEYEQPVWFKFWRDYNKTVNVVVGEPIHCFSAIFAPGNIKVEIYHSWDMYDPQKKKWTTVARIPFPILGGRLSGYRGYTQTTQLEKGSWRCRAETKRGAALGQTAFRVREVERKIDTKILKF